MLAVLTDIQGNLTALEAVLAHADHLGADAFLCLGDLATGPKPAEVIERLRERQAVCVRGNMDEAILAPPPRVEDDEGRRFAEIDAWCAKRLTPEHEGFLRGLPLTKRLELGGSRTLLACHGSPRSPSDGIAATTPEAEVHALLSAVEADVVAVGHLHEAMLRQLGRTLLLNPGSVGWPSPLRDGLRPLSASYALVESHGETLHLGFHRLHYSAESFQRDVIEGGMPQASWYLDFWRSP